MNILLNTLGSFLWRHFSYSHTPAMPLKAHFKVQSTENELCPVFKEQKQTQFMTLYKILLLKS